MAFVPGTLAQISAVLAQLASVASPTVAGSGALSTQRIGSTLFMIEGLPGCVFKLVTTIEDATQCGGVVAVWQDAAGIGHIEGNAGSVIQESSDIGTGILGFSVSWALLGASPFAGGGITAGQYQCQGATSATFGRLGPMPAGAAPANIYYFGWWCYAESGTIVGASDLYAASRTVNPSGASNSSALNWPDANLIVATIGHSYPMGMPGSYMATSLTNAIGTPDPISAPFIEPALANVIASIPQTLTVDVGLPIMIVDGSLYIGASTGLVSNTQAALEGQPQYYPKNSVPVIASSGPGSGEYFGVVANGVFGGLASGRMVPILSSLSLGFSNVTGAWSNPNFLQATQTLPTTVDGFDAGSALWLPFPYAYDAKMGLSGDLSTIGMQQLAQASPQVIPQVTTTYAVAGQPNVNVAPGASPPSGGTAVGYNTTNQALYVASPSWSAFGKGFSGYLLTLVNEVQRQATQAAITADL